MVRKGNPECGDLGLGGWGCVCHAVPHPVPCFPGGYGPPPAGRGAPPPPPPFTSYIVSTPPGGFPPPQGFPQGYGAPPQFSKSRGFGGASIAHLDLHFCSLCLGIRLGGGWGRGRLCWVPPVPVPLTGGKGWAGSVPCTAVGFAPLSNKCTSSMGWLHELTQHKDPVLLNGHLSEQASGSNLRLELRGLAVLIYFFLYLACSWRSGHQAASSPPRLGRSLQPKGTATYWELGF